jgi:hypothetical protein
VSKDRTAPQPRGTELRHDIFVGETVKSVLVHAFVVERAGNRQPAGDLWKSFVKRRIEARDLRHSWEARSYDIDRVELGRQMKGGEPHDFAQ